jgi:crotonobetainyl-CoA:carnitine CoA-transferase CaiB-like acyl-CoA transferase
LTQLSQVLAGVTVVERDGRLAVGVCGQLLRGLGATVLRWEREDHQFPDLTIPARARALRAVRNGKLCHRPADSQTTWEALLARADVVLLEPERIDEPAAMNAPGRVVCSISAFGLDGDVDLAAGEVELQAQAGLMAVTGSLGGPPESIAIPVLEMVTAINAATAVLAALRSDATSARLLDIALFDSSLALFTTFVGTVHAGKGRGYRLGAAHHLCAPWNVYPTQDGWLQLCSANDEEWRKVLGVIGRSDLQTEPRYGTGGARVACVDEVDAHVSGWTATRTTAEAVAAFQAAGIPVGRFRRVPDLLADRARRGDRIEPRCSVDAFLKFDATAVAAAGAASSAGTAGASGGERPLSGVRVLEIGPYTAGPLAGRYLADLGAEVIKIEPAGGEVSRRWDPKGGPWSVFFVNANIGKKFLSLDLRVEADRAHFLELAATSDVVLTNLKPGALDRLGVGPAQMLERFPRLVFCSISGFGLTGDARPALDTVVQAEAGVMSLVGDGAQPVRIGVSIADQGAAHAAPLAILAALAQRSKNGRGGAIDLSMFDVTAWLTELAWPSGEPAVRRWTRVEASDGWVMVDGPADAVGSEAGGMDRRGVVDGFARRGLRAVPVLEMDEVFAHPAVQRRVLVCHLGPPGETLPVLRAPQRLSAEPPPWERVCAEADADREELLRAVR